ncbi:MAG: carbohydrate-binding family 9-like protein [Candidatus Xenobiia bacterium LiM19]
MNNRYTIVSCYQAGTFEMNERLSLRLSSAHSVNLSRFDGSAPPGDLITEVRSLWNDTHLCIAFSGRYSSLRTAPPDTPFDEQSGKTHRLWEISDVYEVFIGPESRSSRVYGEFQVSPDSRWIDIFIDARDEKRKADFQWKSAVVARSQIDAAKMIWYGFFFIPFRAFGQDISFDIAWNCNFYRISGELSSQQYLSWAPVGEVAFHKPHLFGEIIFKRE